MRNAAREPRGENRREGGEREKREARNKEMRRTRGRDARFAACFAKPGVAREVSSVI